MHFYEATQPLFGSEQTHWPGDIREARADPTQLVRIVLKLRPREPAGPAATFVGLTPPLERDPVCYRAYTTRFGSDRRDVAAVLAFCRKYHLKPLSASAAARMVVVVGTVSDLQRAFCVELDLLRTADGDHYRSYSGPAFVPLALRDIVTAIAGLDDRSIGQRCPRWGPRDFVPFTVPRLARIYNFPQELRGAGQRIAILDFEGTFVQGDLDRYFGDLGISRGPVRFVGIAGRRVLPGGNLDHEPMLDLEVAGAVAPASDLVYYLAPRSEAGWLEALATAVHDRDRPVTVLSISWADIEAKQGKLAWSRPVIDEIDRTLAEAALLGITVTVAAGDFGSDSNAGDGAPHVMLPASSPFALACGGTSLYVAGDTIERETVWNAGAGKTAGGGVSEYFAKPVWQATANVPVVPCTNFAGRGVPDVAADADLNPGYQAFALGSYFTTGGTSAAAPLWAGLIALINERLGTIRTGCTAGYFTPLLYCGIGCSPAFHDIEAGNNGAYQAASGWDPCTGWGSPDGIELMNALIGPRRTTQ